MASQDTVDIRHLETNVYLITLNPNFILGYKRELI